MPRAKRSTAGINTTIAQMKYRGRGIDAPQEVHAPAFENTEPAPQEVTVNEEARMVPGEDEFSLSAEERQLYGIKDHEEHGWIRDPGYWKDKVPGDRCRQFMRENPGGRIILEGGQFVTNGIDLILVARPKAEVEKMEQRNLRQAQELWAEEGRQLRSDDFNPEDRERLKAQMYRNSFENQASGMIGPQSPSSGMAYEDYIRYRGLSEKEIEAEERSYSMMAERGTSRDLEGEAAEAVMRSQRERRRDNGSGKFISIPPNVRPRNLMKGDR